MEQSFSVRQPVKVTIRNNSLYIGARTEDTRLLQRGHTNHHWSRAAYLVACILTPVYTLSDCRLHTDCTLSVSLLRFLGLSVFSPSLLQTDCRTHTETD